VALLALLGALSILLDWREVRGVVSQATWKPVIASLGITAVSYLTLSYSFALVNRLFRIELDLRTLFGIGFLSSVMIATVGGVAGHSLRLLLLTRRGQAAGDVMAPSLFHGYLESLIFFALIPAGLGYLALTHPLSPGLSLAVTTGAAVLGLAFAMTAVVFFVGPVRAIAMWLVGWAWHLMTRQTITAGLRDFEATLRRGMGRLRSRPLGLALPLSLIVLDRVCRLGIVWLCFQALGGQVDPAVVVTGFAVGVAAGVMSMVPGGLGVQEGSMAGAYHLLGVPFEQAVLVAFLFRLVYYMIPFGVSLLFYRNVLRERVPQRAVQT
jgi:uncharacterized protein (TIRG00374 family)